MPISLNHVNERRFELEKILNREGLKDAERAVLTAAEFAWSFYDKEINIVDRGRCMSRDMADPKYKIKASVGISFLDSEGQVLLNRSYANVFSIFKREIEEGDFNRPDVPVTIFAVHRGLREANLQPLAPIFNQAILSDSVLTLSKELQGHDLHARPTFLIRLSECNDKEIQTIRKVAQNAKDLAWVSLPEILKQQADIDKDYRAGVAKYKEANPDLSQTEFENRCRGNFALLEIRDKPIKVGQIEVNEATFVTSKDELEPLLRSHHEEMKED